MTDAMGAQRSTCKDVIDQVGNYQIPLKGTQKTFFDYIKQFLQDPAVESNLPSAQDHDKGHCRIERRTAFVI